MRKENSFFYFPFRNKISLSIRLTISANITFIQEVIYSARASMKKNLGIISFALVMFVFTSAVKSNSDTDGSIRVGSYYTSGSIAGPFATGGPCKVILYGTNPSRLGGVLDPLLCISAQNSEAVFVQVNQEYGNTHYVYNAVNSSRVYRLAIKEDGSFTVSEFDTNTLDEYFMFEGRKLSIQQRDIQRTLSIERNYLAMNESESSVVLSVFRGRKLRHWSIEKSKWVTIVKNDFDILSTTTIRSPASGEIFQVLSGSRGRINTLSVDSLTNVHTFPVNDTMDIKAIKTVGESTLVILTTAEIIFMDFDGSEYIERATMSHGPHNTEGDDSFLWELLVSPNQKSVTFNSRMGQSVIIVWRGGKWGVEHQFDDIDVLDRCVPLSKDGEESFYRTGVDDQGEYSLYPLARTLCAENVTDVIIPCMGWFNVTTPSIISDMEIVGRIYTNDTEDQSGNSWKLSRDRKHVEWFRSNLRDTRSTLTLLVNGTLRDKHCSVVHRDTDSITLMTSEGNDTEGCVYNIIRLAVATYKNVTVCSEQKFGCDGVPESNLTYDVCGICGGDGLSCSGTSTVTPQASTTRERRSSPSVRLTSVASAADVSVSSTVSTSSTLDAKEPSASTPFPSASISPWVSVALTASAYVSVSSIESTSPTLSAREPSVSVPIPSAVISLSSAASTSASREAPNQHPSASLTSSPSVSPSPTGTPTPSSTGTLTPSSTGTSTPSSTATLLCDGVVNRDGICDMFDCNGVVGGLSVTDACGVCGGDNTSCADCNGIAHGSADVDLCGVCEGSNDCIDCEGIVDGDARMDACDICNGDNDCFDCNMVKYGPSLVDLCGICGGSNDCVDCSGTANGASFVDVCGVCDGGTFDVRDCDPLPLISMSSDKRGISFSINGVFVLMTLAAVIDLIRL